MLDTTHQGGKGGKGKKTTFSEAAVQLYPHVKGYKDFCAPTDSFIVSEIFLSVKKTITSLRMINYQILLVLLATRY